MWEILILELKVLSQTRQAESFRCLVWPSGAIGHRPDVLQRPTPVYACFRARFRGSKRPDGALASVSWWPPSCGNSCIQLHGRYDTHVHISRSLNAALLVSPAGCSVPFSLVRVSGRFARLMTRCTASTCLLLVLATQILWFERDGGAVGLHAPLLECTGICGGESSSLRTINQ